MKKTSRAQVPVGLNTSRLINLLWDWIYPEFYILEQSDFTTYFDVDVKKILWNSKAVRLLLEIVMDMNTI